MSLTYRDQAYMKQCRHNFNIYLYTKENKLLCFSCHYQVKDVENGFKIRDSVLKFHARLPDCVCSGRSNVESPQCYYSFSK